MVDRRLPTASISVIIPTYNRAAYLTETIDSIVRQTLLPLEILVVDDGSSDTTKDVIQELRRRQFPFELRYFEQVNQGPSAARNLAMRHARGDLLAFLDADDVWEPTKLEWQLALLISAPEIGAVCCNYSVIGADGEELQSGYERELPWEPPEGDRQYKLLLKGNFCHGSASAVLIRKSVIDGEEFDETLRLCEDWDFWLRMARRTSFAVIERPLARIRRHPTNLQKGQAALAYFEFRFFLKWRNEIEADRIVRAAWRRQLLRVLKAMQDRAEWSNDWWARLSRQERGIFISFLSRCSTPMHLVKMIVVHAGHYAACLARDIASFLRRREKLRRLGSNS